MQSVSILILGKHSSMMQRVLSFLHSNGYVNTKGVLTNVEVKNELLSHHYQLLIIGGSIDNETRNMIQQLIKENYLGTKTIQHFGNPASLIAEIKTAV